MSNGSSSSWPALFTNPASRIFGSSWPIRAHPSSSSSRPPAQESLSASGNVASTSIDTSTIMMDFTSDSASESSLGSRLVYGITNSYDLDREPSSSSSETPSNTTDNTAETKRISGSDPDSDNENERRNVHMSTSIINSDGSGRASADSKALEHIRQLKALNATANPSSRMANTSFGADEQTPSGHKLRSDKPVSTQVQQTSAPITPAPQSSASKTSSIRPRSSSLKDPPFTLIVPVKRSRPSFKAKDRPVVPDQFPSQQNTTTGVRTGVLQSADSSRHFAMMTIEIADDGAHIFADNNNMKKSVRAQPKKRQRSRTSSGEVLSEDEYIGPSNRSGTFANDRSYPYSLENAQRIPTFRSSPPLDQSVTTTARSAATAATAAPSRKRRLCGLCRSDACPGRGGLKYCAAVASKALNDLQRKRGLGSGSARTSRQVSGSGTPRLGKSPFTKQEILDRQPPTPVPLPDHELQACEWMSSQVQPAPLNGDMFKALKKELNYLRAPKEWPRLFRDPQTASRPTLNKSYIKRTPVKASFSLVPLTKRQRNMNRILTESSRPHITPEQARREASSDYDDTEEVILAEPSSTSDSDGDSANESETVEPDVMAEWRLLHRTCEDIARDAHGVPTGPLTIWREKRTPAFGETVSDTFAGPTAGVRAKQIVRHLQRDDDDAEDDRDSAGPPNRALSRESSASEVQRVAGAPWPVRSYPRTMGFEAAARRYHLDHLILA